MEKQSRSGPVMQAVLDAVAERLMADDESLIRIPQICDATGVNYGSVYHHFGSREGVIDAAYNMIYSTLAEEDIARLGQLVESAATFDQYLDSLQLVLGTFSSGEARAARRKIRVRIVAAATTRPDLRRLIGATQTRLTNELVRIVELGQERGWLRRDLSARSIAVLLQVALVGQTIDDISSMPIGDDEWEHAMGVMVMEILNLP
jgi:AcrR family transcriptional regulator